MLESLNKIVPILFESKTGDKDVAALIKDLVYPSVKPFVTFHNTLALIQKCITSTSLIPEYTAQMLKELSNPSCDELVRHRILSLLPNIADVDKKKSKEFQAALSTICKDSEKKPASRVDALICLSVVDLVATDKWYKDGCLGHTPTIFSVENIKRPTEDYQLIAAVKSCQRFLPPKSAKYGAPPGFKASKDLGPLMGLCLLATHPRHSVRKEATDALLAAMAADADLKYSAWTAFLMLLWGQPAAAPKDDPPSPTGEKSKPKSAAKPAGKKGKPAPKGKASAAAAPAAFVHPLVVEKPKFGKKRYSLWDLTGEGTVLGENSRREDPSAENLFTVLASQLCADEKMSDDLLAEIVLTSGHSSVSGPIGNFWTCTNPNLVGYFTGSRSDAFSKIFGHPFDIMTMSPSASTMAARLWRSKQAVTQQLIEGLQGAGNKPNTKAAIARAICSIVSHTGHDGLFNSLVTPPPLIEYPDASESEGEDENAEPKPAKDPIVTPSLEYSRLIELITKKTELLSSISSKEAHVYECTPDSLEAAIQKQLEDDDVVPRYNKEDHNVKRDKSQKKLYSAEDEEWEREMVRRRNAEKGIEDPKVAKARAETRVKFNEIREKVGREVDELTGYLMAIIEVARYPKNTQAVHSCLPVIVPAVTQIIRSVQIRSLIDLCTECLEWLFSTTPVVELQTMAGTLARMTKALVIGRTRPEATKDTYPDWVLAFVEHVVSKRIRAACSRLLPSTSYSIIFPTIQEVLRNTSQHSFGALCQQQVLAITSTNCGVEDLPHRTETSAALLVVIDRTPTLSKTGTAALALLSQHFQPNELGPVTDALVHPTTIVREAVLVGLKNYPDLPKTEPITRYRILACTQDENKGVSRKADDVWKYHELVINEDFIDVLVPTIISPHDVIVNSSAGAMAVAVEKFPDLGKLSLQQMFRAFDAKLANPTTLKSTDRKGVAKAMSVMIRVLTPTTLELVSKFCTARGLCDPIEEVRDAFLSSYQEIIATHGREHQAAIYPTLQKFFQGGPPTALGPGGEAAAITPVIKEAYTSSIVVLMGTLSAQMDKSDHLESLVNKLVDILNTPSIVVARAVCNTMEILVKLPAVAPMRQKVVTKCLDRIIKGSASAPVRRSYAHGLVGLVKGSKLPALHEFGILQSLYTALDGKGHTKEGALIALTVFSERMEGLYEPYVVDQIGLVVEGFSGETNVKKAAEECAAAMMRSLTHFGVRQILPPLLASFDTDNWRTSCSALNLLGQMSFCSPQQLSAALPKVMPVLVETLTSSHREVQTHAWDALRRVGGVIMNPEIAAHANTLLQALRNPSTQTDNALEALLYTRFTNSVDAASLALIEPILRRGLTERVSTIKLKSAQIIGSVAMLIEDPTLILPYLEQILVPLKKVLIDEFPDCRSTAAKALGSLVTSLGEEQFPGIVEWCFDTLCVPENSHVERSGAAQGACEVIAAIGGDKLENYLEIIKDKTTDPTHQVREGFLQVLVYMPHALGAAYQPHLRDMTPCVVGGLSDDMEGVRNMAVKAGQTVVHLFGMKCLDQLLPPLQVGLGNPEWRVRLSSLQLLGDLLMRVATENMKVSLPTNEDEEEEEEDEEYSSEEEEESEDSDDEDSSKPIKQKLISQKGPSGPMTLRDLRRTRTDRSTNSLVTALGEIIGTQILGSLMSTIYMLTVDLIPEVARQAKHVWKALVDNTPAMLRKVMPNLTPKIIEYISEDSQEKREIAGRCVGDLVSRLGDGFLPFILPVLEEGLREDQPLQMRLGATLGIKEVVRCISRAQLSLHMDTITGRIVGAIKDDDLEVREEAGLAFDILFKNFGGKAIENLIQNLIDAIVNNDEQAMTGTMEMVKMRPKAVLAQLIPTFTQEDILSETLAKGLVRVAEIAGEHIRVHILELVPILCATLGTPDLDYESDVIEAVQEVASAAETDELYALMGEIRSYIQSTRKLDRRGGLGLIGALVALETENKREFRDSFIQNTIRLYGDPEEDVQRCALATMQKVSAYLEPHEYMSTVHASLQSAAAGTLEGDHKLPALDLTDETGSKKSLGLNTILLFYTKPLLSLSDEQREQAANGLLEVIDMISIPTLKMCVGDILGPMIRKMIENIPASTKVALLNCTGQCLKLVGDSAKMYIPMVQTAVPKNLANPDPDVRRASLKTLWIAMTCQDTKLGPIINSLVGEMAKGVHAVAQTAIMRGFTICLTAKPESKSTITPLILSKCADNILPLWDQVANVQHAAAVGRACGMLAAMVSPEKAVEFSEKCSAACSRGGNMVILGMAGWAGLMAGGAVGNGLYQVELLNFVEDFCNSLPAANEPEQQLTCMKALKYFGTYGACEMGISDMTRIIQTMKAFGEKLVTGNREKTIHVEDKLRQACVELIPVIPSKFQSPIVKMQTSLGYNEYEDWETASEYQDDQREEDM
eukprot:TRINITY_DN353_c2_g1_i1.p1 TRINITY_DN353_c2_g1~~TRINITY_DN353_c2_g1_i1.p1  ORF type:complete len:2814 (+),score=703.66 TRINITY_DN353_c2_g1_i1:1202-8443(+)